MTQNRAAQLVQWCISAALVTFLIAIFKPMFWIAVVATIVAAAQFGTHHNTGRFLGSKKTKLADRAEQRTLEGPTTIIPLHADPAALNVEDRSPVT